MPMRARSTTTLLAAGAALAVSALAGCGGEEKAAKPKPTGSLTVAADDETVFFRQRTTVSVTLLNARGGDGDRPLRLLADPHPYDGRFEPVAAKRTDAGGEADFRVRVPRDTRYRAEVVGYGLRSDVSEVEAAPVVDVDVEELGSTVRLEARVLKPRGMKPRRSKVHFYFRPKGERGYRRIGSASWGNRGRPRARTTASAPSSSGVVVGCYRKPLGVGYTGVFDPDCGRPRLPNYYFPK